MPKNKYGVTITDSEYRELKNLRKQVEYNRKKADKLTSKFMKVDYPLKVAPVIFQPPKATTSIKKIRSRKEFEERIKSYQFRTNPNYIDYRVAKYKENVIARIEANFPEGEKRTELTNIIKGMTTEQYAKFAFEEPDAQRIESYGDTFGQGVLEPNEARLEAIINSIRKSL